MSHPPPAERLQALAAEILDLSKHYSPPTGGFGAKSPLVRKAEELIRATQTPLDHGMSLITNMAEGSAIRTLLSFGVFDALPGDGSGITAAELEVATGAQAKLLERLLRILAGSNFLAYNAARKTYCHTPISRGYLSTELTGSLFPTIFDEIALTTKLPAYFRARGAQEPDGDEAKTHNPITWAAGQEGQKTAFEILEQDPEKLAGFVKLMAAAETFRPWTGFYDYAQLATREEEGRPVLVDVGGADGTCVAKILAAHPEIKPSQCVVQDRPAVIEAAKRNPALPAGVHFSAHDFFDSQPPATHRARAYQLRAITHDWSDSAVVSILRGIVPAMAPDSRVLIADNVLPEEGVSGMAAFMDLAMLCLGGKERTRGDFERVCAEAGLRVEGVWRAEGEVGFAVVEAVLA